MGGRGANSSLYTRGQTTGNQKTRQFYDKSDKYRGMNYLDYEKIISKRKTEWIGLYDDNGNIVIAGTSYIKGSVALPVNHPDFNKVKNMTHNHPDDNGKTRYLGGTFSEKDVMNGINFDFNNTRAVASEKTYIFNKGRNASIRDKNELYNKARMSYMSNRAIIKGNKNLATIERKLQASGRKLNGRAKEQIYYGAMTRYWRDSVKGTGYNYIEKRNK